MATVTIRKKGKRPITFKEGGLHRTVGVPMGEKIPASKVAAAAAGRYGRKGVKQAALAKGALAKGRRTAARRRRAHNPGKSTYGSGHACPM
jgi:hypothetical protein